jgi:F-type H+-transporting ATPase subunit epsilon
MIKIKIISQAGTVFDGEVLHVLFPGTVGRFAIYPKHAPLLSSLVKGNIICFLPEEEKAVFPIQRGFVEIKKDEALVCVELVNGHNFVLNDE